MRFDHGDVLVVYDPKLAERLARRLVEFAQIGLTMVAGDPSRFVREGEAASAVVVSGGMLTGEGEWTDEHILKLASLTRQYDSARITWAKCPECGHQHYDAYGGVPRAEPDCVCERNYLPRAD
jgi:hypothetical protein